MDFLNNLLLMLVLMLIGFIVGRIKLLKQEDTGAIANIIYYISTPALIFYNLTTSFRKEQLLEGMSLPLIAAGLTIVFFICAWLLRKVISVPESKSDVFDIASTFSNTIFLGLPVIISLFGAQATFFVVLYDLGATLLFWTLGMVRFTGLKQFRWKNVVLSILNFPIICFMIGLAIVFFSIPVPAFLARTTKELGGLTTPLAMIFVGLTLSGSSIKDYLSDAGLFHISWLKLILMPILAIGLTYFLPLSPLAHKVIVIEAAMPVMITTAIMARKLNRDYSFASRAVAVTTLLFFITVPFFMILLHVLFG